jgi:hypothetical protein
MGYRDMATDATAPALRFMFRVLPASLAGPMGRLVVWSGQNRGRVVCRTHLLSDGAGALRKNNHQASTPVTAPLAA